MMDWASAVGFSRDLNRADEVQEDISVRRNPHFLIGVRGPENADLEQIAGADDGHRRNFRLGRGRGRCGRGGVIRGGHLVGLRLRGSGFRSLRLRPHTQGECNQRQHDDREHPVADFYELPHDYL